MVFIHTSIFTYHLHNAYYVLVCTYPQAITSMAAAQRIHLHVVLAWDASGASHHSTPCEYIALRDSLQKDPLLKALGLVI